MPRMQEVIVAIQEAVRIERGNENGLKSSSSSSSKAQSSRKTLLTSFLEIESPDISRNSLEENQEYEYPLIQLFHVGDTLVWKYDGEKDSVPQVTKEAYINCNTTNPAASYTNGDRKVKLERSGPFFFISGSKSNCVQGEKLHIVVMSSRGCFFTWGTAPSPAHSPALLEAQAVLPPATGSSSSLTSRIGVLAFVGLAIV
ncbi:PREDICTED: early nodulin-like protein 3 [Brassica oleracea var. oleracea]|uniref:early nodulin-like protein 3 n=1 Tax=Brassica oleracea var. oleracea TaxID=109376 RepID=UPI0006A6CA32|nr:PREDICTED: early nodulin-like protein 3 [Brassica oleracea var. oleracea]